MRVLALAVAACVQAGWIDADTPKHERTIRGYGDNSKHTLVMSDEFETPHRSFKDGQDPRWTAVHKNDYTNMALHFYHASAVTTSGGALNISTSYSPTSFQSAEDDKGFVVMTKRRKPYSSGMVQGWGKFCFTGGIMEVRAKLPGAGRLSLKVCSLSLIHI